MSTATSPNVVLSDGTVMGIRRLDPEDHEHVRDLLSGLNAHDRKQRFFTAGTDIETMVRSTVATSPHHVALGAFDAGRLIGVAQYDVSADACEGELAVVVNGHEQSQGVGTLLLEHLASVGKAAGVRRFTARVLADNWRMIRVLHDLGLPLTMLEDGDERVFTLSLVTDDAYAAAIAERERTADVASLRHVLAPTSIAVIGAGRHSGVGHAVLRNLLDGGYTGRLGAVNPHADRVLGVDCARSVTDLGFSPELALICVPADAVPDVLIECGKRGTRAAVIVSAGVTGTAIGARVAETARTFGIRLVGPNCVGVVNTDPLTAMNATFMPGSPLAGPVGMVTQSGGFGIALAESLRKLGIGVSSMVSTGDKYDVSGNDLLLWWRNDPRTKLGVLYLESFGNPRKFARLARSVARVKPVLAVRTGDTEVAQRAAASHTAATATPVVTRDALYEQAGVIAVDSIAELVGTAAALSWQPLPSGPRVAVISNAGGAGVLAADACLHHGLALPELADTTIAALSELLPTTASSRNPVDTTATVPTSCFGECLSAILADETVDAVIAITTPTALGDPMSAVPTAARRSDKPVLAVSLGQLNNVQPLPVDGPTVTASYSDPAHAAAVLGNLSRYARWLKRFPDMPPALGDVDVQRAIELVAGEERWLGPLETTELLRCFGIPVLETAFAATAEAAVTAFHGLKKPVVLKAHAAGLIHKSTAGGVVLNVADERQVRDIARAWSRKFGDDWRGVAIQTVVPTGRELLVGAYADETFGPLVVFGLGGTDTDLIADRAARLAPLTAGDAGDLVEGLRCSQRLFGVDKLDIMAIRDVLSRVSRLVELLPEVVELDLNPLSAFTSGCQVLDARIRVKPPRFSDPLLRRLRL